MLFDDLYQDLDGKSELPCPFGYLNSIQYYQPCVLWMNCKHLVSEAFCYSGSAYS